jgi:ABC-type phosphate/phosphonate transport system, periplasmic component
MQAIAAPVPSPPRYAGLARYCSEFLVRDDSGWASLEDTFGQRIGWMPPDSQSGFNAPRAMLARYVTEGRRTLYRQSCGPFMTPAKLMDALRANEVDVVAVDGFYLDLVRHSEPAMLAGCARSPRRRGRRFHCWSLHPASIRTSLPGCASTW